MKAVVIEKFGHEEQMKLLEMPVPIPGPAEILIEIKYASVNPMDWMVREGMLEGMLPHKFPIILGFDAAGIIQARGVDVERFHVGDRVFAYCQKSEIHQGTYAEYVTSDGFQAALMPENLGFKEAAAIPLAALTAWQALFDAARLKEGEIVLIQGGAGGVGSFAIQLAHVAKARVLTTALKRHHAYLLSNGADMVIDYSKEDVSHAVKQWAPEGVDVVLDLVGGDTLIQSMSLARPGGRLISTVGEPDQKLASSRQIAAASILVKSNGLQLDEIARLIGEGKVKPPKIVEYDLADAALALRKSELHHTEGKMVLKVS